MKCDNCPAAWEDSTNNENGYECEAYGCVIRGLYYGGEGESCYLTKDQVNKRLKEWEDYTAGKIKRPEWVARKFLRELDSQMTTCECGLPGYPPVQMSNGCHKSLYGSTDIHYDMISAYRQGYEDCENGKTCDPYKHYQNHEPKEDIFE